MRKEGKAINDRNNSSVVLLKRSLNGNLDLIMICWSLISIVTNFEVSTHW